VVDTPQRRKTESGISVTSFRVASTARRYDRHDGQWIDGDSLYLKVTCWRQLADNVDRSVVKGDPIVVTGRLFTRTYEAEGQRRSSYELEALALGLDLTRGVAAFSRVRNVPPTYEVELKAGATSGVLDPAALDATEEADGAADIAHDTPHDDGDTPGEERDEAGETAPADGRVGALTVA
jgi:single-strand DNA-binding protein